MIDSWMNGREPQQQQTRNRGTSLKPPPQIVRKHYEQSSFDHANAIAEGKGAHS